VCCAAIGVIGERDAEDLAKGTKAITNRERWIVRELYRNSYELAESEIDEIILDALRDVNVDLMHEERLRSDAEYAAYHANKNNEEPWY